MNKLIHAILSAEKYLRWSSPAAQGVIWPIAMPKASVRPPWTGPAQAARQTFNLAEPFAGAFAQLRGLATRGNLLRRCGIERGGTRWRDARPCQGGPHVACGTSSQSIEWKMNLSPAVEAKWQAEMRARIGRSARLAHQTIASSIEIVMNDSAVVSASAAALCSARP